MPALTSGRKLRTVCFYIYLIVKGFLAETNESPVRASTRSPDGSRRCSWFTPGAENVGCTRVHFPRRPSGRACSPAHSAHLRAWQAVQVPPGRSVTCLCDRYASATSLTPKIIGSFDCSTDSPATQALLPRSRSRAERPLSHLVRLRQSRQSSQTGHHFGEECPSQQACAV